MAPEKPLNILLHEDLTMRGGAQLWLMDAGKRLKAAGHNITFLLPSGSLIKDDVEAAGIKVETYEHEKSAADPDFYKPMFTQLLKDSHVCVTLVRQKRGLFQNVSFVADCIADANLPTFLISKTGTPDATYLREFYGGKLLDKEIPQCCTVTIAEYTRQFIIDNMNVPGKFIQTIYNGTDTKKFKKRTGDEAVEFRKEAFKRYPCNMKNGEPSPFVVSCIGRYVKEKNQKLLLEAAKILIESGRIPDLHILLVGEGQQKQLIIDTVKEKGLENYVSLMDFTKEPFYVFERADLIALTSILEGLPNVLLEALAMERPCVATHITGCPEVVVNGKTGYTFPTLDAEACADAIEKIYKLSPAERKQFATNGSNMVLSEHDKTKQFDKMLTMICEKAELASKMSAAPAASARMSPPTPVAASQPIRAESIFKPDLAANHLVPRPNTWLWPSAGLLGASGLLFYAYMAKVTSSRKELVLDYRHHKRTPYSLNPFGKFARGFMKILKVAPK